MTSEDVDPYSPMLKQEKYGDSMVKLFPIVVNNKGKLDESKETPKVFRTDDETTASSRSLTNQEGTLTRHNNQYQRVPQSIRDTFVKPQEEGRRGKSGDRRFPQTHNSIIQSETIWRKRATNPFHAPFQIFTSRSECALKGVIGICIFSTHRTW